VEFKDPSEYTKKDFVSDQDIRWCSGCGDYHIHNALTSTWSKLGIPKENFAVISGIGCSSRFPYYANTFGFHTIHGRAPTVAMGVKLANPELSVWVITGDGDGMSIGGNHLLHSIRRNPDINIILFNNEIYGLTKGQTSPTSQTGIKTKSSPLGSVDTPLEPLPLAVTAGATFIARVVDTNLPMMREVFGESSEHKGVSFIEAYTNCVIFNDGAFAAAESRLERKEATVELKHGEPLIFGKDRNKGIILDGFTPKAVVIGENGIKESDILVHDEKSTNPAYLYMLATMKGPELPIPVGILRRIEKPTYESQVWAQEKESFEKSGNDLDSLLHTNDAWTVK
jgi:2-oxoglutarate ferredoxin oxidoreductase subunit beta